jgi:hypothetical protein
VRERCGPTSTVLASRSAPRPCSVASGPQNWSGSTPRAGSVRSSPPSSPARSEPSSSSSSGRERLPALAGVAEGFKPRTSERARVAVLVRYKPAVIDVARQDSVQASAACEGGAPDRPVRPTALQGSRGARDALSRRTSEWSQAPAPTSLGQSSPMGLARLGSGSYIGPSASAKGSGLRAESQATRTMRWPRGWPKRRRGAHAMPRHEHRSPDQVGAPCHHE